MKKVKFFTLGCKVNQYETQSLREQFLNAGFRENSTEKADIYLINTCTVTHHADRESRRLIRKAIHSNPKSKVIVTGCYVEKDAQEILEISGRIQIIPNQQKHRILELLDSPNSKLQTSNNAFVPLMISDFWGHERAFVKIQDGCNNFCAYCKVPLVRGKSRSRALKEIIAEVKRLTGQGFKEIVLTGICLGDYDYRNFDLSNVLKRLKQIGQTYRIRLSSIEPQLVSDRLIEEIGSSQKFCPHLHIPLQSGDNQILERMNRRYTQKDYLNLIAKIKKRVKDVAITTDVLVGFPGESDKNFRNTIDCLKKIEPLRTHIFSFSPRYGTRAFDFKEQIDPQIIKQRVYSLQQIAQRCSYRFRRRFLRKKLAVLIESQADKKTGFLCGYSQNYIRVAVEGADKKDINTLVGVKITKIDSSLTAGQIG
ncbi:MAG: tRNA (N(6)-L-threonylcarbamoyladenosine(37)-C(2))-methylthiotransferase MtaB [Candidatus Omnitrophica bacterium]|nr:tRNA (N(6)-L-threonylcarbamoyladenosine(37)-C(2))-methylthiotransferase MtaB [Candidatus Omnitrophota bacterium]